MLKATFLRDVTVREATEGWTGVLPGKPDDVLFHAGKTYDTVLSCGGTPLVYVKDGSDYWAPPADSLEITRYFKTVTFVRDVLGSELRHTSVCQQNKRIFRAGQVCRVRDSGYIEQADGSDFWWPPEDSYKFNEALVSEPLDPAAVV